MSNEQVKYFRIGKINKNATVVGMWEIDADKLPHDYIKYFYDDKNRVVRFEKYEREFPGASYRIYKYEGDSNSVKVSEWFDRFGNLKGIHRYYCDEKGLMVKREELDGQNNVKYYILSRYDEQERLIEEAWYNPDDSLDKRDRLIYDSPDLSELTPSSEEKYNSSDELNGVFHYKWDERYNLLEKKWCNKAGELKSYYTYKYNDKDLLTWIGLYHEDDTLQMSQNFAYDEKGNKISEEIFDGKGNLVKRNTW